VTEYTLYAHRISNVENKEYETGRQTRRLLLDAAVNKEAAVGLCSGAFAEFQVHFSGDFVTHPDNAVVCFDRFFGRR